MDIWFIFFPTKPILGWLKRIGINFGYQYIILNFALNLKKRGKDYEIVTKIR